MKHFIFSMSLLSTFSLTALSVQAAETRVLKPSFQCQSKEFAVDDTVHAVVTTDNSTGQVHIDVARTWFGGMQKSTYQVKELATTGIPGVPRIYEGEGLRLSIQSTINANEQYLAATLGTQIDERTTQDDTLICLPF